MPIVTVKRTGVRPSIRKVPTSTCAVVMPVTLDRVGNEVGSENEQPTEVESLDDALKKFQPEIRFKGRAGEEETEFQAHLKFRSIKDFDPAELQKRQEVRGEDGTVTYAKNDIADLKNDIDLLYRIKERWQAPAVRRAWNNADRKKEILRALDKLKEELDRIAKGGTE